MSVMPQTMTATGRAALALAGARNMPDYELADLLGIDRGTLSRKKNGRNRWTDEDALRVSTALGDDIDGLIADLQRLRATRQYQAPPMPGQVLIGHES